MSRIDNIVNYAQKEEEKKITKEITTQQKIEDYKDRIRALKPRIDELIEVGNACAIHGIPLTGKEWGGHEGYDTHQFITNSWSHLLGFVGDKNITRLGIFGGGACNYNLTTDGENIEVSGEIYYILKRFIKEFDTFETEFYKYVDNLTGTKGD